MRYFFILIITLFFINISFAQSKAYADIALPVNRAYTSAASFDTINFNLDRSYAVNYVIINGTDVDEDQDGDYTEFLLKINNTYILDTVEFVKLSGIGKDGQLGKTFFEIKNLHPGQNTIILGNTETADQTDYAVVKNIFIYCTDVDLDYEKSIENQFHSQDYGISVYEAYNMQSGQNVDFSKTFYDGYAYYIVAGSPNIAEKSLTITLWNGDKKILSAKNKKGNFAKVEYVPDKDQDLHYTIEFNSKDSKSHIVSIWVFARELQD